MRKLSNTLLMAIAGFTSIPALAALPDPGYWSFDNELNGQPGRGIQIERQGGETVILSYYGYRTDGSATFYQATGKIVGQKTLTADLVEYKNGPAIGGSARSGETSQTIGKVEVKFDTSHSGTITLPGEQEQPISRFVYDDFSQRLQNRFSATFFGRRNFYSQVIGARITFKLLNGELLATFHLPSSTICEYKGNLDINGTGVSSEGTITPCQELFRATVDFTYGRFSNLKVSETGVLTGNYRAGEVLVGRMEDYRILGMCYMSPQAVVGTGSTPTPCTPEYLGISPMQP